MMSLRLNVEALDRWEPQDSQRGRRPSPINDAAPLSSFHTKTDGLRERKREREEQVKYRASVCYHFGLFTKTQEEGKNTPTVAVDLKRLNSL